MPTTQLCRTLGIDHPILSVGFAAGARPELAAAVSNAGALGVLGGSGFPRDFLRERVARTRELTDRPFGVKLTPWFEGDVELGSMWAGESVELVTAIRPAGEVVAATAAEADEILARLATPSSGRAPAAPA